MPKSNIYALYKGDQFIELGTISEIARKTNLNEQTIRKYTSPTYKKRNKNYNDRMILIKLRGERNEVI